jgi:hypothetical protein
MPAGRRDVRLGHAFGKDAGGQYLGFTTG